MLAVVLALASAIGYGGSDFAAGLASRSAPVIQITLLASVVSGVVVAAALPFAASPGPSGAALAWGFVAGLGGTLGAFALYLGFRNAAFSVAGPLSAVASAGFSVLAGLLFGERPTALALTGIDRAGSGSGLWPVAAAAAGELAAALVAAVTVRSFTLCSGRARLLAATAGAAGAGGTILFFFATHQGFLAVTAVLTSLYPATTIVLARTVLGERLTGLRLAGLGLAGVCVSLIAVGGAG